MTSCNVSSSILMICHAFVNICCLNLCLVCYIYFNEKEEKNLHFLGVWALSKTKTWDWKVNLSPLLSRAFSGLFGELSGNWRRRRKPAVAPGKPASGDSSSASTTGFLFYEGTLDPFLRVDSSSTREL